MQKKTRRVIGILLLLLLGVAYYLLSTSSLLQYYLENPALLKEWLIQFGWIAPLLIILLQVVQGVISIFPSQITTIIAGFIFGPILGLLYSLIGGVIGATITFLLARRYGKEVVAKFFDTKELVNFSLFFKKKKAPALFFSRIVPLFPNDVISFTAGITTISLSSFILYSTAGFIIQMLILTSFGSELATGKFNMPLFVFSLLVGLLLLIVLFKEKIKKILIEDIRKLEKEEHVIEQALEREFKKI